MPHRWLILGVGGVIAVALAVVLALFQPWKLWVDDTVDQVAPAGAVPITVAATTTTTPAPATTVAPAPTAAAAPTTTTATTTTTTTVPPTTLPPVPVGGEFISIDHGTTGTVVLLQDATGAVFVRLESLDTSNGPDLFVYLSTNPPDGEEGVFDDDFVNLGRLAGNVGSSNYVVPPGTDLSRYASVVIWCDRFNSAFGAAPLS
jgi:hypothetical protein